MKKELRANALARIINYFEIKGKTKYVLEKIAASEYNCGLCDSLVDFLSTEWHVDGRLLDSMNGVKKKDFDQFLETRIELRKSFLNDVVPWPINRLMLPGLPPMTGPKTIGDSTGQMTPDEFRECEDTQLTLQTLLEWAGADYTSMEYEEEFALKRLLHEKSFRRDISVIVKIQRILKERTKKAA